MATLHKIHATRSGSHPTMGDWDNDYTITYRYTPGRPEVRYLRNGDPGYPADPAEVEFVSITPTADDNRDQKWLEEWAADWLADHHDEAVSIAEDDRQADRDAAAEYRREL